MGSWLSSRSPAAYGGRSHCGLFVEPRTYAGDQLPKLVFSVATAVAAVPISVWVLAEMVP